jgi:hypothetical protein
MVSDFLIRRLEQQAAVICRHAIEIATEHVCHVGGALSLLAAAGARRKRPAPPGIREAY